jgi:hypothetical protein
MLLRAAAMVLALLTLSACGAERAAPPADDACTGTIEYRKGSVPPPHHYSWRLEVGESTATVAWTPGYGDLDPWTATVDVSRQDRVRLHERLDGAGLFAFTGTDTGSVGGATGRVRTGGGFDSGTLGTSRPGSDLLADVVAAAEELVPAAVWRDFEDRQARQPQ